MVPRGDVGAFAAALARALDDGAWTQATGALARRRVAERCAPQSVGRQLRAFLFRDGPAALPSGDASAHSGVTSA
jgi:hypothetical protein